MTVINYKKKKIEKFEDKSWIFVFNARVPKIKKKKLGAQLDVYTFLLLWSKHPYSLIAMLWRGTWGPIFVYMNIIDAVESILHLSLYPHNISLVFFLFSFFIGLCIVSVWLALASFLFLTVYLCCFRFFLYLLFYFLVSFLIHYFTFCSFFLILCFVVGCKLLVLPRFFWCADRRGVHASSSFFFLLVLTTSFFSFLVKLFRSESFLRLRICSCLLWLSFE